MDQFVHRENLAHYRRLLAEPNVTNDPVRHEHLNQLLAKEIAKGATAPGCFSNSESDSDEQALVLDCLPDCYTVPDSLRRATVMRSSIARSIFRSNGPMIQIVSKPHTCPPMPALRPNRSLRRD
jgi:hypothetical protein